MGVWAKDKDRIQQEQRRLIEKLSKQNNELMQGVPENMSVKVLTRKLFNDLNNETDSTKRGAIKENILILNLALVGNFISKRFIKMKYSITEEDDLWQIGANGLFKAINGYDNSRKEEFSTYAMACIRNEILMNLKNNEKEWDQKKASLDAPAFQTDDDGESITEGELIVGPDKEPVDKYIERETIKRVYKIASEKLTPRQEKIFKMYLSYNTKYGEWPNDAIIARQFGCSRELIRGVRGVVFPIIRKELKKQEVNNFEKKEPENKPINVHGLGQQKD